MTLIGEWRWVVRKAWSLRLAIIAGLFSGAEVILPLFVTSMPRGVFAALSVMAAIGSAAARITDQPSMERRDLAKISDRRRKPRPAGSGDDYD